MYEISNALSVRTVFLKYINFLHDKYNSTTINNLSRDASCTRL